MRKAYAIACGITLGLLLLLCTGPGTAVAQQSAAPQQTESQKTPAPPHTVIPVAEVATQATEVANLLRMLNAKFSLIPEIETIRNVLPEVSRTIATELAATVNILQQQPTLEALQTQQQIWQQRQLQTTGWLNILTGQATQLHDMLHRLADLHQTWTDTHTAAQLA
jgi:hypothetical protein